LQFVAGSDPVPAVANGAVMHQPSGPRLLPWRRRHELLRHATGIRLATGADSPAQLRLAKAIFGFHSRYGHRDPALQRGAFNSFYHPVAVDGDWRTALRAGLRSTSLTHSSKSPWCALSRTLRPPFRSTDFCAREVTEIYPPTHKWRQLKLKNENN
jgi:hypothetical protein